MNGDGRPANTPVPVWCTGDTRPCIGSGAWPTVPPSPWQMP
jgi:hypothetical protein